MSSTGPLAALAGPLVACFAGPVTIDERLLARILATQHDANAQVRILRVAQDGDDAVVAARFADRAGRARRAVLGLRRVEGVWRSGGSVSDADPGPDATGPAWSAVGFGLHGRRVRAFWVTGPATSLTLATPAGAQHTDTVEGGIALLIGDGSLDDRAAEVSTLDGRGRVIARGPAWPAPTLGDSLPGRDPADTGATTSASYTD